VVPGAVNVIPGAAEFSLDIRAESDEKRDALWAAIQAAMDDVGRRRGVDFACTQTHSAAAVRCAPALRGATAAGIHSTGDHEPMVLASMAGHDAMAMAAVTDVGMLFIRCHDGISHHPDEDVRPDDVSAAADALEAAVLARATVP
jgi:allantoate deiminase